MGVTHMAMSKYQQLMRAFYANRNVPGSLSIARPDLFGLSAPGVPYGYQGSATERGHYPGGVVGVTFAGRATVVDIPYSADIPEDPGALRLLVSASLYIVDAEEMEANMPSGVLISLQDYESVAPDYLDIVAGAMSEPDEGDVTLPPFDWVMTFLWKRIGYANIES